MQQPNDDDLGRAARGERAALEELVGEYYRPVAAYLARLVDDADEAQDLTQEVFLRMANVSRRSWTQRPQTWNGLQRDVTLGPVRRAASSTPSLGRHGSGRAKPLVPPRACRGAAWVCVMISQVHGWPRRCVEVVEVERSGAPP